MSATGTPDYDRVRTLLTQLQRSTPTTHRPAGVASSTKKRTVSARDATAVATISSSSSSSSTHSNAGGVASTKQLGSAGGGEVVGSGWFI